MSWGRALAFWFREEGGYVNHPDDPGGETKFGIAKRFHPDVDIQNLTEQEAARILFNSYWSQFGCLELEPFAPLTAWVLFDYGANSSADAAVRDLQQIVLTTPDGIFGVASLKAVRNAVKSFSDAEIATQLLQARVRRIVERVRSGKSSIVFLGGWMKRCVDLAARVNREARS